LSGDISSASKEPVLGAWQSVAGSGPVLLDFSKVDYINSSGIALIIQILMEADKSGQKVAAFGLSPHFQKVFTMVGIGKYAGLHKDEATAAASL
jgi:anti-anti-sigma factor